MKRPTSTYAACLHGQGISPMTTKRVQRVSMSIEFGDDASARGGGGSARR
jgi:hypothetical protein